MGRVRISKSERQHSIRFGQDVENHVQNLSVTAPGFKLTGYIERLIREDIVRTSGKYIVDLSIFNKSSVGRILNMIEMEGAVVYSASEFWSKLAENRRY